MSIARSASRAIAVGAACAVCTVSLGGFAQPALRTVGEVQGRGTRSPYEGARVVVEGTVVHIAAGDCGLGGYFLAADVDEPSVGGASRGLFVYAPAARVQLGQLLRVEGRVVEYLGRTELSDAAAELIEAGRPIGVPQPLTDVDADTLEGVEGMRVSIRGPLRVLDNHELGGAGRLVLGAARRLAPTQLAFPAVAPAGAALILDDGCDRRDPWPPAHGAGAARPLRVGDLIERIEGVVDEDAGGHRVHATSFDVIADNPRPAAPPTVPGRLRVVGFNVGRFMGLDGSATSSSQLAKLLSSLAAMDADVLALSEVGHGAGSTALSDLVAGLADVSAKARDYRASTPERAQGDSPIAVALIHDALAVESLGPAWVVDSATDARFDDHRNRPALVQHYAHLDGGEEVMVAVAHLKSKAGSCSSVGDEDVGDGQGSCGATRLAAAAVLGEFLAERSAQLDVPTLLMGDLNSYAAEPPVALLRRAGLSDQVARFGGTGAYSYVYRGAAGYLDHAMASPALAQAVAGVGIWHINADEAPLFGAGPADEMPTPYRCSDHDPVIVGLFGEQLLSVPRMPTSGGGAGAAGGEDGTLPARGPVSENVGERVGCDCRARPRGCRGSARAHLASPLLFILGLRAWRRRARRRRRRNT